MDNFCFAITSYCVIPLTDPFSGTESAVLFFFGGGGDQNFIRFRFRGSNYENTEAIRESYGVNLKHKHNYTLFEINSEHGVVSHKSKFKLKLGTHDSPYSIPT
jgi:hypothetical protein